MSDNNTTPRNDDSEHYTVTRDESSHEVSNVLNHRVNFTSTSDTKTDVAGEWSEAQDAHVRAIVGEITAEREQRETIRANHRNFNRFMILLGALVIGIIVTFVLTHNILGPAFKPFTPYAFVITIMLDSSLAAYAYIKKY